VQSGSYSRLSRHAKAGNVNAARFRNGHLDGHLSLPLSRLACSVRAVPLSKAANAWYAALSEADLSPTVRLMLVLHYRQGWSLRTIAAAFHVHHHNVRRALELACIALADSCPESVCATSPFIGGLLRYEGSDAPRQQPAIAAMRREQLAAELEDHVLRRAAELAEVSECMDADCYVPHNGMPDWSQWEMRYLNCTGRTSIPNSVYDACRAGRYCDAE
jgi:hypothetical protein